MINVLNGYNTIDMEGKELVNITVKIANRSYPLKVKQEDEVQIQRIVEEVNSKVDNFQKMYKSKDKQDCLSMALLTYAVDLHKQHPSPTPNQDAVFNEISQKVDQLDELLDFLLQ